MKRAIISHLEHALREAHEDHVRDENCTCGIEVYLSEDEINFLIDKLESEQEQTQLYAGKPENLPVPKGENPSSAGNQQGRIWRIL